MLFVSPHSIRRAGPNVVRRTIAILIDYTDHLGSGYETQLRTGFEKASQAHDCNLVFVVGRPLFSPDPVSAVHNEIYKLVHPDSVDGVVLVAAGLASACGVNGLRDLCKSYRPMALCSLGLELSGVPSIVIDNHSGMQAVIEHIVREHGCQRVAFIGGPQDNADAGARLQVYRRVLARNGLPFDVQLTAFADFTYAMGRTATQKLLESGLTFDALVAANDRMALGAIDALKQHGLRVPRDVRVTGFDDLISARFSNPPLTTARQPLETMAALAMYLVNRHLDGQRVPEATRQSVELVKRRSCGCHTSHRVQRTPTGGSGLAAASQFLDDHMERMRVHVNEILTAPGATATPASAQLLNALKAELEGQKDAFTFALDELLELAGGHNEFFDDVQTAISFLRDELVSTGLADRHQREGA